MHIAYFCFCAIRLPFVDVSGRAYIVGYVQMWFFFHVLFFMVGYIHILRTDTQRVCVCACVRVCVCACVCAFM